MYSHISENYVKNINNFYALMIATVTSYKILYEKLGTNQIDSKSVEDFLIKENFIENTPSTTITVKDLLNTMTFSDTAVVLLSNSKYIGILNKTYYDTTDSGNEIVIKYFINHDIGNNIKYKCIKCGNCCRGNGTVIMTLEEADAIAKNKNLNITDLSDYGFPVVNKQMFCIMNCVNGKCKFLSDNNECKVIDTFPYNCQVTLLTGLFIYHFGMGATLFRCPAIGDPNGDTYTIDEINKEVDRYLKKYPLLQKDPNVHWW